MWEGTTSRVMAADRPYGEFYNFYSISLEDFGYHLVYILVLPDDGCKLWPKYVGVVLYTG